MRGNDCRPARMVCMCGGACVWCVCMWCVGGSGYVYSVEACVHYSDMHCVCGCAFSSYCLEACQCVCFGFPFVLGSITTPAQTH